MIILVLSIVALIILALSWFVMLFVGPVGLAMSVAAFVLGIVTLVSSVKTLRRDPSSSEGKVGRAVGIFVTVVAPIALIVLVYAFYQVS